MSIESLTTDSTGRHIEPVSPTDWDTWVSASSTRNYALDDPLLDWLNRHGEQHGFERDSEIDERTDFLTFILRKGHEFENAVIELFRAQTDLTVVLDSNAPYEARHDLAVAEHTFELMRAGAPVIHQGVLRDAETRTYGAPDLLIRSDVLNKIFPCTLQPDNAAQNAPDLGTEAWHYRVVDVKFATLRLNASGQLGNSESALAYKLQVFSYNRALGRLQGYLPPEAYLLGRGWEQRRGRETTRVFNCMDRIAPVPNDDTSRAKGPLFAQVDAAETWLRKMRIEGASWSPLPRPSIPELRPNAKGDPGPWRSVIKDIVRETDDLTQLRYVGPSKRWAANEKGFERWTESAITPADVGVSSSTWGPQLQALLDVNRDPNDNTIRPRHITAARDEWHAPASVEFYIDFETVSDLDDDFSQIPERGGQSLIFMIGCGHLNNGEWQYKCFTANSLSVPDEAAIIDEWLEHMAAITKLIQPSTDTRAIHWSNHEVSELDRAFNRHPEKNWNHPNWFDFLRRVIEQEPVVVRGAHDFGLKSITNAMYSLSLIDTQWGEGPTDGLGAMVGAWWCAHEAERQGCSLLDLELMQQIQAYNEVDCKAMMDIIRYLRREH
jgi:hypothetical protein